MKMAERRAEIGEVIMTRAQAEEIFEALNKGRFTCVAQINKVNAKRSLTDAQKLPIITERRKQLSAYVEMQRLIGETFNIGGY